MKDRKGMPRGAFIDRDSPYHDYFMFHDEYRFPYSPTYDGWWGHDTLPKLNYEGSRGCMNISCRLPPNGFPPPFNADGWRLDVAADLGHSLILTTVSGGISAEV